MIIFSFDCAIKNLGFCCIEYDDGWRDKISNIIDELYELYRNIPEKQVFLNKIKDIFSRIESTLSNIIKLHFANIIDLIPDQKVGSVKYSEILPKLKYILQ